MKVETPTPEQIIAQLREADADLKDRATIGPICQKLAISGPICHRLREQYGRTKADAAQKLNKLKREYHRMNLAVADLTPDKADTYAGSGSPGKRVSPSRRCEAVAQ